MNSDCESIELARNRQRISMNHVFRRESPNFPLLPVRIAASAFQPRANTAEAQLCKRKIFTKQYLAPTLSKAAENHSNFQRNKVPPKLMDSQAIDCATTDLSRTAQTSPMSRRHRLT
jgi:hypothetical protein